MTRRQNDKPFYLRIMPLGASITEGAASSSDGTGYRKWLRAQLRSVGWPVNMVGSKQAGRLADRDHEGHPGWTIDEVVGAWRNAKYMKPNVVLINVGTNDCLRNIDTDNAGNRLKVLTDDIFNSVDGVTVIISTLARSRDNDRCASAVSAQYRDLVRDYRRAGRRAGLADLNAGMSLSHLSGDGIHPTDEGYKFFADLWWRSIHRAEPNLQPPVDVPGLDDRAASSGKTCNKVAGNARGPVQSQVGSGHDDGLYKHNRIARGVNLSGRIQKLNDPKNITDNIPWHMFFANIVVNDANFDRKAALDDWIRVFHDTRTNKNTYYYRQNNGGGNFGPSRTFDVDMNCDSGPRGCPFSPSYPFYPLLLALADRELANPDVHSLLVC